MNFVASHNNQLALAADRLEVARSGIEERFLKGGEALMSVNDILTRLIEAISQIAGALDAGAADGMSTDLKAMVQQLQGLADAEQARQDNLAVILSESSAAYPVVGMMNKALNYLSTCATATRITGAGLGELTGFADDISSYVDSASQQIVNFSKKVERLNGQLTQACADGQQITSSYVDVVPHVSGTLTAATDSIGSRRAELAQVATQVGTLAEGIRSKVARVLSALQIGDVTRQRIEHVQAGIEIMEELAAPSFGDGASDHFEVTAQRLLLAQVQALAADFDQQTRDIVAIIHGFAEDGDAILALRERAAGAGENADGNIMGEAEKAIGTARSLVKDMEATGRKAREARTATLEIVSDLLGNAGSIGNLRDVRDDIRCLSINAYLRCHRLGSQGRSVGVIATEIGLFAEKLGTFADDILRQLSGMEQSASRLEDTDTDERGALSNGLDEAIVFLRRANEKMEHHLAELSRHGEAAAGTISRIAGELDFNSDLGTLLQETATFLKPQSGSASACEAEADPRLAEFSERLFALYTMASERDVHQSVIPVDAASNPEQAGHGSEQSDEDLFEDALF
ncbi:hypothetical protein [Roseibium aggregatum]|uniref:Methyl-accepting chemotaxis protein n=1 Tax=Roseibium aggregatum TaxID=187304 RepID=A0A926S3V0_9HYPH|nr:hypothetical protein [Roseibium aggregatum]MBD1544716.1 hypothetical protein [Roseibium aggregatum]